VKRACEGCEHSLPLGLYRNAPARVIDSGQVVVVVVVALLAPYCGCGDVDDVVVVVALSAPYCGYGGCVVVDNVVGSGSGCDDDSCSSGCVEECSEAHEPSC
jgi:hypothetical protein